MTVFFTSDHHFHHSNVLEFEDRPYETLDEMNQGLIESWNNVVRKTDTVFHLGDFCFGKYEDWVDILNQLRGDIILIKGNHDKSKIINRVLRDGYLKEIYPVGTQMKAEGFELNFSHYPMEIGNRPNKFSCHGHLHSHPSRMTNQINLGIDSGLSEILRKPFGEPISLDELTAYLKTINPQLEELFHKERGI